MQHKGYDSVLELWASRGLMCTGSGLSLLTLVVAVLGMRCPWCPQNPCQAKGCVLLAAGLLFILSGVMGLVLVCWVTNSIICNFYSPMVSVAPKRELGEVLHLGWVASFCLLATGSTFCCSPHCAEGPRGSPRTLHPTHSPRWSGSTQSSYSQSQFV